jgi:CRP-like cAMP-binding protein
VGGRAAVVSMRTRSLRQRWLLNKACYNKHWEALLRAKYETFEQVLGDHMEDEVWRYFEEVSFSAGEVNHTLYLLQRGRVSSYLEKTDDTRIRLRTMKRGAFINENSLYLDFPVSYTVIVDTSSMMLAIDRKNMKVMEAQHPKLALEIQRTVLRHAASARNKLERDLDSVNQWESLQMKTQRQTLQSETAEDPMAAGEGEAHSILKNDRKTHFGQKARFALRKWATKGRGVGGGGGMTFEDAEWDDDQRSNVALHQEQDSAGALPKSRLSRVGGGRKTSRLARVSTYLSTKIMRPPEDDLLSLGTFSEMDPRVTLQILVSHFKFMSKKQPMTMTQLKIQQLSC